MLSSMRFQQLGFKELCNSKSLRKVNKRKELNMPPINPDGTYTFC